MTSSLLDGPTRESLRSKAAGVEKLVGRSVSVDERPSADENLAAHMERRREWHRDVRDAVLDLVNALPAGAEDYEGMQLCKSLIELGRAVDGDTGVTAEASEVQLAAMGMGDVLRRLERRLEHATLEDADEAARYVFGRLPSTAVSDVARLLGVSTKTIGTWRAGQPVRQNAERVKLVAQLIAYLHYSLTATGVIMWFDNERPRFDGRSPLGLLNESVSAAWEPLVSYARGGRGQLAG